MQWKSPPPAPHVIAAACAVESRISHLIPLNPGESRFEFSFVARGGMRNRTATLARTPGYATFGSTSFLSSAMDSYQAS